MAGLALWQIVGSANVAAKVLVIVAGAALLLLDGAFVLIKKATIDGTTTKIPYTPKIGAFLAVIGAAIIIVAGAFMKSRQTPKR